MQGQGGNTQAVVLLLTVKIIQILQGRKQVLEFWFLVLLLLLLVKVLIVLLWVLLFCQGVLWLNFETFLLEDLVTWP